MSTQPAQRSETPRVAAMKRNKRDRETRDSDEHKSGSRFAVSETFVRDALALCKAYRVDPKVIARLQVCCREELVAIGENLHHLLSIGSRKVITADAVKYVIRAKMLPPPAP